MNDYKPTSYFVQENEKGQYVYSDFLTEGGYVINKSDYNKFRIYTFRYVIGIIASVLLSTFIDNIVPCLIAAGVVIISGEILFRFKFLKGCLYLPRYVRKKKSLVDELTASSDNKNRIIKMVLLLAFAILIVFNAYMEKYEGFMFIASWVLGACVFIIFILYVIAVIKNGGKK